MPLELDSISDDGDEHEPPGMEPWVQLNATPLILPDAYMSRSKTDTEKSYSDPPGSGTSDIRIVITPTAVGRTSMLPMSEEEPIYHRDGGRAEFPPAYHDIQA